jgi:dTDP-4-dehydrorhamnose reductase
MHELDRPVALLITGISGYVGRNAAPLAIAAGHTVTGTYLHHEVDPATLPGCDLHRTAIDHIPALIDALRPDVVLHTAAAWPTEAEAQAVIVEGTRRIAEAVVRNGAHLIHMSTDLVFDGEHAPYDEKSPPSPVNFYGAAKAEAERIAAELVPAAALIRTSLVTCFDPPDPRTKPILDALRGTAPAVTLFTDEYRCPVRVADLAAALVELASRAARGDPYPGILHIAGPERLSRYDLGLRIARYYGLPPWPAIAPGLTRDSGMVRPRDCTLSIALAQKILQTPLLPLP